MMARRPDCYRFRPKKREEKKVRIANYLQGPSNCIASSTYYSAAKQTVDKTRDGFYGDR